MQFLYTLPSGLFEKSMKLGAKNLRHCMYSTYSMYSAFTVHMYIVQCTVHSEKEMYALISGENFK